MATVNKIEFIFDYENNIKVSELSFQVKVNGQVNYDYKSEGINIYKINDSVGSLCDLSGLTKLDDNYVLNNNEQYAISIEELAITGMEYDSMIWQSDGRVFINNKDISTYEGYCMGSKYDNNKSESFAFTLPKGTAVKKEEVNKIEFVINYENNTKVSDLKLQVKVNGKVTNEYTYESLKIYKANNNLASVCNIDETQTKLDGNYILNNDEEYIIKIEELAVNNMEYDSMVWQSDGRVFVNGKNISTYKNYCMGSIYDNNRSESFTFSLPKGTIVETETKEEIKTETKEEEKTTEIVEQKPSVPEEQNKDDYYPFFIGFIGLSILLIAILLSKISKQKNNDIEF